METILKTLPFLSDLLDVIPSYIFVFDRDVRVVYCNQSADHFIGSGPASNLQKLCGDALHCINSQGDGLECGKTQACSDCVLRKVIVKAFDGEKSFKINADLKVVRNGQINTVALQISAFPINHDEKSYALLIADDVSEINELRELLPICAWCKKIKDDKQYWGHVEDYITSHMDVSLTHGICPDCLKKHFGKFFEKGE
jgi:PAS domain-containing protein